jgi:hypothetical protein
MSRTQEENDRAQIIITEGPIKDFQANASFSRSMSPQSTSLNRPCRVMDCVSARNIDGFVLQIRRFDSTGTSLTLHFAKTQKGVTLAHTGQLILSLSRNPGRCLSSERHIVMFSGVVLEKFDPVARLHECCACDQSDGA